MMAQPPNGSLPEPTERFQRVLAFASDEADGLGHGFVTCQHLLYALSRESRGLAGAVLTASGVTANALHEILVETAALHDRLGEGRIDLADEARDTIERAVQTAKEWGHRILDTEHILYGLIITPTSADEMLSSLQIDPKEVLNKLYTLQQSAPPPVIRDGATHAYRLTLESAWLLSLAVDTARRLGARQVSSIHLLAAIVSMPNPAQTVLRETFGVQTKQLFRSAIKEAGAYSPGRLPLSNDVQRIIGYAIGEAWNRGHLAVDPVHLAMGLARGERHPALDILAEIGAGQADLIEAFEAIMPPAVTK